MARQGLRKQPSSPQAKLAWFSTHLGLAALLWASGQVSMTAQTPTTLPPSTPRNTTIPTSPDAVTVLYVNPNSGSDQASSGKTAAAPYRTITFALQQAGPGTTIQLAPGNYTKESGEQFPIVLKPGVILRGDESSKGQGILIQGSGKTLSKTFAQQEAAIRASNGSEIRGVTVTNTVTRGTGIWVEDVEATIANSTFTNNNRDGVFVTGSSNPTITGSVFTKNSGNGISVASTARGEIKGNSFVNTGFGLSIGGNSSPRLDGNRITQNTDGIFMSQGARPTLRNNVITDSQRDGIVARDNSQPDLGTADSPGNNTIRNNGRDPKMKGLDLNNKTTNTFTAIGNNIDPKKIAGRIDFTPGGSVAFADVQGHWAEQQIRVLASRGIITGFPDGNFKPNDPVTRVQFAAIVLKAFAPTAKNPVATFSDVKQSFWGYTAIQSAVRGGFMAGFPDKSFKPNQQIPRVQSLVSLVNGLQYGKGDASLLSRYQDAKTIPSYATGAIAAATQRQLVVNYPSVNQLNPNREATRAEVAAFIYQALVSSGKAQAIQSPYIVSAASAR
jgi:parallel beta-helix repeat protein